MKIKLYLLYIILVTIFVTIKNGLMKRQVFFVSNKVLYCSWCSIYLKPLELAFLLVFETKPCNIPSTVCIRLNPEAQSMGMGSLYLKTNINVEHKPTLA